MDEDDLFAGSMEIDDPGANAGNAPPPAPAGTGHFGASRPGVDEDMSEVAEIMLNLKVCRPMHTLWTLCCYHGLLGRHLPMMTWTTLIVVHCLCVSCALSCANAVLLSFPAAYCGASADGAVNTTVRLRRCRKVCRPRALTGASLWTACLLRSACHCAAASAAMLARAGPSLDPALGCQGCPLMSDLSKTYAGLGGLAAS